MNQHQFSLPNDDLPPTLPTEEDVILRLELARSTSQRFYEACDRITQAFLYRCDWQIAVQANIPVLVISCPDVNTYWQIISLIDEIGKNLNKLVNNAKIRIYAPNGKNMPLEIELDERLL
ncbi:MAG: hypothetical protein MUD14_04200 [Hydrococcus sp. Prado102]|nr:hypothetical protein [Hydrococcus sp. Prado102]